MTRDHDRERDPDPFADVDVPDERLADWVDGTMSGRDRERFEAELRVSPRLREQLADYERTVRDVREALRAPTQEVALADRVMAAIASGAVPTDGQRPRVWPYVSAVACAAALLAIAIWVDAFGADTAPATDGFDVAIVESDKDAPGAGAAGAGAAGAGAAGVGRDLQVDESEEAERPATAAAPGNDEPGNDEPVHDKPARKARKSNAPRPAMMELVDESSSGESVEGRDGKPRRARVRGGGAKAKGPAIPGPKQSGSGAPAAPALVPGSRNKGHPPSGGAASFELLPVLVLEGRPAPAATGDKREQKDAGGSLGRGADWERAGGAENKRKRTRKSEGADMQDVAIARRLRAFFAEQMRAAPPSPEAGSRSGERRIGGILLRPVAPAAAGQDAADRSYARHQQRDWLVVGPPGEVARVLRELRRYADEQQRVCRSQEMRVGEVEQARRRAEEQLRGAMRKQRASAPAEVEGGAERLRAVVLRFTVLPR